MDSCLRSPLRIYFICGVFSLLAVAFIGVVGYDLFVRGPMSWHIAQPSALEGGLEALLLGCLICVASVFRRRWLVVVTAVSILLYLRRHNAELTLLVGWLYWELMYAIGRLALRRVIKNNETDDFGALLAGICIWLVIISIVSIFHFAYPMVLLVLLCVLGGGSLVVNKGSLGLLKLLRGSRPDSAAQKILLGLSVTWFIVLTARTQNVIGYDSVWYLSRSDTLLAPLGSIFQNLNLVSPVHYFPKLWEALLLPVTAFDQLRVQQGTSIGLLVLVGALVFQLCGKLGLPRVWRYMGMLLIVTIPACANPALQIKSDMICLLFLVIMALKLHSWFVERSVTNLLYAIASGALAVSCKYTAIPFVFIALVFVLVEFFVAARPVATNSGVSQRRGAIMVGCLAMCVALIFVFRTWLLTGVPTVGPDPLLKLWLWLGFTELEPAGTLNWTRPQVWSEVPRMFYEWLFAPNYMPHIRISWQGNYWFLFLLTGFLAAMAGIKDKLTEPNSFRYLVVVLSLLGLLIAVAWRYHNRGGDGNYYMFPLVMVTCLSLACAAGRLGSSVCFRRVAVASVVFFSVFHAGQSFIVASWSKPGTREFDARFGDSPFNGGAWRSALLRRSGLLEIGDYLTTKPADTRVVAYGFVDEHAALLPVPTENLQSIKYARGEYVRSVGEVVVYLQEFNIQYLLLSSDQKKLESSSFLRELNDYAQDHKWEVIDGKGASLYKVPPVGMAKLN